MNNLRNYLSKASLVIVVFLLACAGEVTKESATRPNVLWIFVEDISPDIGAYGNPLVKTPILDSMASHGIMFTNVIAPAPVCSPSRSSIITGIMSTTTGTHNHHSSRTEATAINLPKGVKTIPELFKEAGYFTFNAGKDDYNFWYNRKELYEGPYLQHPLYGKLGKKDFDWSNREDPDQPFFGQIQLYGSKHIFNSKFKEKVRTPIDTSLLEIPSYYADVPLVRKEWGEYLETMQVTDDEVGAILERLRTDGLLENTAVFFFADHGMRSLRHKQFLYEGGLKVPLIVMWPGNPQMITPGMVNDKLISAMDIGASSLVLAGIDIPKYMDGENFFDPDHKSREYVISTRDRCDFTIDRIRSVRTHQFKYIRNFHPDRSYMQPNYRDEWPSTQLQRQLFADGKLNELQSRIFLDSRPEEELYDLENDPDEIDNLINDSDYREVLIQHQNILKGWMADTDDQGQYAEDQANLKYMLGIWGEQAVNVEYDLLRKEFPGLDGSLKAERFKKFELVD